MLEYFDLTDEQAVAFTARGQQTKPFGAGRRYAEQPVAALVPVRYPRQCSNIEGLRRPGFAAFSDEQDTKRGICLHAAADHVEITLLEDPQRQRTAGIQNRA